MDLLKIHTDSEFASSVVPAGQLLVFTGYDTGLSGGNIVTRYKDSSGNFGNISGGGGSGETDFYKCASVDTTNHTWTGYKATFADGKWSYAVAVTSGLTYSSGSFTPVAGSTYNDGATIKADLVQGIPTDGLVFYAPLDAYASTAVTGQQLTYNGTVTYTTYNGVPAANVSGSGIVTGVVAASGLDSGWAISFWVSNSDWRGTAIIAHFGAWNAYVCGVQTNNGYPQFYYQPVGAGAESDFQDDTWYHVIYQQSSGTAKAYVNGVEDLSVSHSTQDCSGKPFYLGSITGDGSYALSGYLAALRIYNRALTSGEITALANEFTPVM